MCDFMPDETKPVEVIWHPIFPQDKTYIYLP